MYLMYQVNLELGDPTPKNAIRSLEFYIASARARGAKVLKVWHGNMETESYGRIKAPIRAAIRRLKREGRIRFYIYSENYNEEDAATRYLIDKYPVARDDDEEWGIQTDAYTMLCI